MSQEMIENRTFDEIAVGDSARIVRPLLKKDIELFAAMSGDVNPAHVDPEYAENVQFHKVIGHGMWGAALISTVLGTELPGPGTIYLGQELRFKRPVGIGDTLTVIVTAKEKRQDKPIILFDCRCINQHGEVVISGTAEVLAPTEKVRRPRIEVPQVFLRRRLSDRIVQVGEAQTPSHAQDEEAARKAPSHPRDLSGRRGLVLGIANEHSIAYGCAQAFRAAGAGLAVTYLNDKAEPFVRPLAEKLESPVIMPCDVRIPGQLEEVFERVEREWGSLDFVLHSIAYAPKEDLHGRVADCSPSGFAMAMDVSCHSFIRVAHLAEPLMKKGGCLLTVTFYGSERVVEHYNLMGPVKAALESACRYLAAELGPAGIRVHAISPGPMRTRAASGIQRFDELLARAAANTPERQLAGIEDVGALAAFLAGDGARMITGTVIPVDGGRHILA